MARPTVALPRFLVALLLAAAPAAAQGPPGPPLPMGMDLRQAPVGAWSAYTVGMSGMPPLKQRFALVARDGATDTLELTTEGGMMGSTTMVLRVVLDADPAHADRVKRLVMQLGDNQPMELRLDGVTRDQFGRLDPRHQVGREKVTVPAGTFAVRHYRQRGASGDSDVWVSDEAPPLGVVKLRGSMSQGQGAPSRTVTLELTGRGKGAHAVVVRPAQPFDPAVLTNQMNRSLGGKGP